MSNTPKYINGPINYVYLKGNINGINKNIYLFMDKHNKLYEQTRCKSFDSVDITYYLYKLIKDTEKNIDFFMEIQESEIIKPVTNNKDIYIVEVENLFKSEFIEESIENNRIIRYSKTNPKVRLHYLDIRDHLGLFKITTDLITNGIKKNFKLLQNDLNNKKNYVKKILVDLDKIDNILETLTDNILEIVKNLNNLYSKNDDKQKYFLNKSLNKYEHNDLKKNIFSFVCENYFVILNNLSVNINNLKIKIRFSESYNIDINEINKLIEQIYELSIDIYSLFTDIYLIRRILDKNYVNECIIYSGVQHSINYIYFLIKYYGFEIIKIYHSEEKDINKIINSILNAKSLYDIYKLFFNSSINYIQCINYEPLFKSEDRLRIKHTQ